MLQVKELESGYGSMQVLWKPSLEVKKGSITSLLGPNGSVPLERAGDLRREGCDPFADP
jgi:ABC-type arginine transport system ATPase subunit